MFLIKTFPCMILLPNWCKYTSSKHGGKRAGFMVISLGGREATAFCPTDSTRKSCRKKNSNSLPRVRPTWYFLPFLSSKTD